MRHRIVVGVQGTLLRRGLVALLLEIPEVTIEAQTTDPGATLQALRQLRPAVLVAERRLFAGLRLLSIDVDLPRVLLVSYSSHVGTVQPCSDGCVCGIVSESRSQGSIRAAIGLVSRCKLRRPGLALCVDCPMRTTLSPPALPLSDRETRVFERIGLGQTTGVIARSLGISVKTVDTYRESIKRKLNLDGGQALLEAAWRWRVGEDLGMSLAIGNFDQC